ncbi:MAG: hypothetical protein P4L79_06030 [Legionella sp.]|uniref:hypothetical protein n=1 Tax=Legionella sp. TaxID=459 RepID=UPI00284E1278|nr:hypothetical protein [Legionella sp.]
MDIKTKKLAIALTFLASEPAFSSITSGQITIINGLANETGLGPGTTASRINVQVSDVTGFCATTRTVNYNGSTVVKWDATKAHSTSQCTGIVSVKVTPLQNHVGIVNTIVYDTTTSTTVPALTASGATTYTAPTNPISNLVLLVTGSGNPSSNQAVSGTAWGINAASTPIFDIKNGALTTVGVPGGMGMAGFQAEQTARLYGVIPYVSE